VAVTSFTSVCRLRADVGAESARRTLSALEVGAASPFAASARTHFARLQILDELRVHTRRSLARAMLIWSTDVDGDIRSYLVEILTSARETLAPVVALCDDAPRDPGAHDFVDRAIAYLLAHQMRVGLQYTNSPGRSATEIRHALVRRRQLAHFALNYQHDSPSERRAAFAETFGLAEIDLREPAVADHESTAAPSAEGVP